MFRVALFFIVLYFAYRKIIKIVSSADVIDKQQEISNKINSEKEKEELNKLKEKLKDVKKNNQS